MSSTGLFVVSNIKQFGKSLRVIEKYVDSLYIHINVPTEAATKTDKAPAWGALISQLYADSTSYVSQNFDLRILVGPLKQSAKQQLKAVDIIFSDTQQPELCERFRRELKIPKNTICLNDNVSINDIEESKNASKSQSTKVYQTVVLGGTFDRIHIGHKIFLTQAVLRACKRLVVGVTTATMTKSKILPELILPVEERMQELREFLTEIDSTLHYDIVPIDDPFGPTRNDPDMDMIVVSAETLHGGRKINELRALNNLKPLDIFVIDIVESNVKDAIHESKVSSSNTRIDLLGTRLKQPEPRPKLPVRPYIIGLTGGIASGKSKMAERLSKFGGYVIDCDKVAHEIYEPGQICYDKVVSHFGKRILNSDGRIDRSVLGPIVFGNPQQLEILNGIVWPELMVEVGRRLNVLRTGDATNIPKIVILEAAVLLKAGWEKNCHEVWSMIVPPEEAAKRVVERNKLSLEEAQRRIKSQLSNEIIVAKSNVVFSSQWDYDFTNQQAVKAWQMLNEELDSR